MNNKLRIIREAIEKANRWYMKYNEAFQMNTEELSGEPSDRTAADVGEEPIHIEYPEITSEDNEPF